MFINHTNHPSQYWSDAQLDAGHQYGVIIDMPFPQIDPMASSAEISQLAQEYAARIIALHPTAVLCQGEFIYCHALVERLLAVGITVVAATSEWGWGERENRELSVRSVPRVLSLIRVVFYR